MENTPSLSKPFSFFRGLLLFCFIFTLFLPISLSAQAVSETDFPLVDNYYWYATWWAYLFFFIIVAVLFVFSLRFLTRKLKTENVLLKEQIDQHSTQLKESIDEVKAIKAQLIQSEKMASIGALTAGIAHEIQNPLNFVNNFSELNQELINDLQEEIMQGNLEEVKLLAKDIGENEEKIKYHGKRADSIVKSMLNHSRNGNGHKEPSDINAVADECLRLSYHGMRAKEKSFNAKLETKFEDNLPLIEIIPQDISRVLVNIFTNAFYAVQKKKNIASPDYQPTVWLTTLQTDQGIKIIIRDNGIGIPEQVRNKIYQPFFTTKPAGEGTGLGLSMSYDIITKGHEGDLTVETKEGEFTEFTIFLKK